MDVNMTGALAANVSLMQPSKTDYLPLWAQIITTLLTAGVTLGAVYLSQYFNAKGKKEEIEREEAKNLAQKHKEASFDFLEIFSKPIIRSIKIESKEQDPRNGEYVETEADLIKVDDLSPYLKVSLRMREFGDILITGINDKPKLVRINDEDVFIDTLDNVIRLIMKLRYENGSDLLSDNTIREFEALRKLTVEMLTPKLIFELFAEESKK